MNRFRILLLLRDGKSSDIDSLCVALGFTPESFSIKGVLIGVLQDLEEAGLILSDPPVEDVGVFSNARIKLSDNWPIIQKVLGLRVC